MILIHITTPRPTQLDCLHGGRYVYTSRPAIPPAFRVRVPQLTSPMRDMRLRLLPYFQNIFALIAPTLYMLSLSKNCPNLNFHCPIFQSHAIALLPGWQVCILAVVPCRPKPNPKPIAV